MRHNGDPNFFSLILNAIERRLDFVARTAAVVYILRAIAEISYISKQDSIPSQNPRKIFSDLEKLSSGPILKNLKSHFIKLRKFKYYQFNAWALITFLALNIMGAN